MKYKKSQVGWVVTGLLVSFVLFMYLGYESQSGNIPLSLGSFALVAGLFIIIGGLFYKLTIEFDESTLKLIYGIGLIRIKFKIDELEYIEIIKTPWYYGLGIRVTPKGMLYNIQGSKAISIKYIRNGKSKSVMVGTPEPELLKRVIEENIKSNLSSF